MLMTAKSFRHAHLLRVLEQFGTAEALAEELGVTAGYISHLKMGRKGIGDKMARKIEIAANLPAGAMDRPPPGEDLERELRLLLGSATDQEAARALSNALPALSDDAVRQLTTALLSRLSKN